MAMTARMPRACALALMFALAAAPVMARSNPFAVEYPFETAIIEYELAGTSTGREVLYIDHGRKALHHASMANVMGVSTERRTLEITTPEQVVMVDLMEKTGTSKPNMAPFLYEEWLKLPRAEQRDVAEAYRRLGFEVTQLLGGARVRESRGEYLGRPVTIARNELLTMYIWQGLDIVLLSDATLLGMRQVRKAVRIETGVAVPASAFAVPADIEIQADEKAAKESRELARTMIESLGKLDEQP